jgi:hypothetical protein
LDNGLVSPAATLATVRVSSFSGASGGVDKVRIRTQLNGIDRQRLWSLLVGATALIFLLPCLA